MDLSPLRERVVPMRKFLLTMAVVALMAAPAMAQRRPGGGGGGFGFGGLGGGDLLSNPAVQTALKLTDDQKKEFAEIRRKANEEASKKCNDKLTSVQKKRLGEIKLQMGEQSQNLAIFTDTDTAKALKLTDKQVKAAKSAISDLEKDMKEIRDEAKGDFRKMFTKMREVRQEAWKKFTESLTSDQKKAFETAKGEKFEMRRGGGFGGGAGGGGRRPGAGGGRRPGAGDGAKKDEI